MSDWDEAIARFEDLLDLVQEALDTDSWDDEELFILDPGTPLVGEPTPAQAERARAALAELDATLARLSARRERVAAELSGGTTRRQAARSYTSTART